MFDKDHFRKFWVDIDGNTFQVAGVLQGMSGAPIEANQIAIYGFTNSQGTNLVIDSSGNWVGKPIATSGGQTPWTQTIIANGNALSGAGAITCSSVNASSGYSGGAFTGNGVSCPSYQVTCSGVNADSTGVHCNLLTVTSTAPAAINCSGGVACSFMTVGTPPNQPTTGGIVAAGDIQGNNVVAANQMGALSFASHGQTGSSVTINYMGSDGLAHQMIFTGGIITHST
jgi:hypothetical protein